MFDLEMMREIGYCHGIENYSRHLSGRRPGEPPPTLLDYLPADALTVVDESHQTIPQIRGMWAGDRSRKEVLVAYGFRLPSALDNRPLDFKEWQARVGQVVHVSATPGPWELEKAGGVFVEQIIRPTGLVDPTIDVRPVQGQVDDLLAEIRDRAARSERVLVTTLTKRMAEDLTGYYHELGVRVRYLHSDVDTLERIEILRDLRKGVFDVLVGINLLREGLDLPEVSLVAILDADKEGFLRSAGALIQTIGRAARHVRGTAILYADTMTDSMRARHRRDQSTPLHPGGLQRRARDHAGVDHQGDRRGPPQRLRPRLPDRAGRARSARGVPHRGRAARGGRPRGGGHEGGRRRPRLRARGGAARPGPQAAQPPARRGRLGGSRGRVILEWLKAALLEVQEYTKLCIAVARGTVTRPFYVRDVIEQFDAIGLGSLTVVILTGMFTGAVLALQSGFTLDQFGARTAVGRLVSASMVKELGPVLTALMVTGRVGSGIAAELGSMMVTDQINALRALGTDPVRKLARAARARRACSWCRS